MRIRAVIFDKDGTLFDFQASWGAFTAELIDDLAEGEPIQAARLAGIFGFDRGSARFLPDSPFIAGTAADTLPPLLAALPGWTAPDLLRFVAQRAEAAPQVPAADLPALMARLRAAGLALGVATNDQHASALAHLRAAGLGEAFDTVIGADSGHGAKPEPGPLLAVAAAAGIPPAACAMVGDSLADLHAARAAGMAAIGVLTGAAGHAQLAPHADAVLPSIAALPAHLALPG